MSRHSDDHLVEGLANLVDHHGGSGAERSLVIAARTAGVALFLAKRTGLDLDYLEHLVKNEINAGAEAAGRVMSFGLKDWKGGGE